MLKPQSSIGHWPVFCHYYNPSNALRGQSLHGAMQKTLIPRLAPSKKRASYHCCQAADFSASSLDNITTQEDNFQVEIATSEAQTALKFAAVRVGGGKAIVVEAVAVGSEAAEAGIRPGQQLFSLSDPIRPTETWMLNDRASLRYIRDAVRMRRAPFIMLELSVAPLKEWVDEKEDSGLPSPLNSYTSESDAEAPPAAGEPDLLSAVAAEAEAAAGNSSSLDSIDLPGSSTTAAPGTIGERLQRNYKKSNSGMTDLEKRVSKRKEYFEQTSTRNDTPFFLGVLAAFLLPALIILGIASTSGYLDSLAAGWAGR
ncbi:hypothetical protein Ndes2437A_g05937 [Nannochloris sp. 'desiccata']